MAHAAGLSTIFTCTNPNAVTINVAVEVFLATGAADNTATALAVPPGGTVQFATSGTAPFVADQILSPVNGFTKGAAKIWSDAKKVQCGAVLVNTYGANHSMVRARIPSPGGRR